jgi:hypothetical protein
MRCTNSDEQNECFLLIHHSEVMCLAEPQFLTPGCSRILLYPALRAYAAPAFLAGSHNHNSDAAKLRPTTDG